jgi:hypothetical protein
MLLFPSFNIVNLDHLQQMMIIGKILLENAEMFSGNFAGFHAEMGNGRA